MKIVIEENEKIIESVNDYDKLCEKREYLKDVKVIMKQIKKINRRVRWKKKNELVLDVKKKIEKLEMSKEL